MTQVQQCVDLTPSIDLHMNISLLFLQAIHLRYKTGFKTIDSKM